MNNKLFSAIMFTVGAAIGSVVTWKIVKTKYDRIVQDEIDSVKEEYANLAQSMKKKLKENSTYEGPQDADEANGIQVSMDFAEDDTERKHVDEQKVEYHRITRKYRTSDDYEDEENDEEGGNGDEYEAPYINGPYVISPEDFNSSPPGYNAQPLDYFSDGILADSWGVKLDIDETIGEDSLKHFGDYQDDILYIRNEREETDYEITRDPRTYDEAVRTNPNPYYGR